MLLKSVMQFNIAKTFSEASAKFASYVYVV